MIARVAVRSVMRHRLRSAFSAAAIAIAVALLADMLMLSTGMEKTFRRVLASVGYEVRVCPQGTLPFGTDAVVAESARVRDALAADARVARWLRVLGTTLYAESTPLFVMGVEGASQSLYRVVEGADLERAPAGGRSPVALNRNAAAALGLGLGDSLALADIAPSASPAARRSIDAVVVALIEIDFDLPQQRTAVLPLAVVQRARPAPPDAASFVLVKLRDDGRGASPDTQRAVAASLARAFPETSVYSMDELMQALERQLAYFKQFATILSTISLFTTFLLIAVVLVIGVGERRGEIAALRSMGVRRRSIQGMVLAESGVLLCLGAAAGAALGWLLAGRLDAILTRSPSLPAGYRFFVPAAREIGLAVLLSGAAGLAAALLPAIQAGRIDIPRALHEEVV
jgi:putative ABC transport system permease protein